MENVVLDVDNIEKRYFGSGHFPVAVTPRIKLTKNFKKVQDTNEWKGVQMEGNIEERDEVMIDYNEKLHFKIGVVETREMETRERINEAIAH